MDTEQTDDNLLLALNLSDSEPEEGAAPAAKNNTSSSSGPSSEYQPTRAERTALSEEAYQHLKQTYRPKIENGNELLHAVEELYFFRKYAQAADFVTQILESPGAGRIDKETGRLLGFIGEVFEEDGRGKCWGGLM
ncbi:hypothetical protein N0V88_002481 [Collariella sp. IMI 366227]|nr:hypothetical protein N0V88_002481 [Collariella sp. IMI 366227]